MEASDSPWGSFPVPTPACPPQWRHYGNFFGWSQSLQHVNSSLSPNYFTTSQIRSNSLQTFSNSDYQTFWPILGTVYHVDLGCYFRSFAMHQLFESLLISCRMAWPHHLLIQNIVRCHNQPSFSRGCVGSSFRSSSKPAADSCWVSCHLVSVSSDFTLGLWDRIDLNLNPQAHQLLL